MAKLAKVYSKKRRIKWRWQALDSKSCPCPLGGEGTGRNPTDMGKLGSNVHVLVDKRGTPLSVVVGAANRHDKTATVELIGSVVLERLQSQQNLCAVKAFDATDIYEFDAPGSDRFVTHVDAPFEKQFLHVSIRDGQAVIEINSVANDQLGETIAFWALDSIAHPRNLPDSK